MPRTSLLPTIVLALTLAQASAAAPGDPGCRFDTDEDGLVTEEDVNECLLQILISPPIYNPDCDANEDGVLDLVDYNALLSYVGLDCTAPVPIGSHPVRTLLLVALLIAGTSALGIEAASRKRS